MKKYNEMYVIGIDHGYGNMKTANCCFPTGVMKSETEPIFTGDLLKWNGMYYSIGVGHKEFTADKFLDEDYYALTLAAIARELRREHITEAKVFSASERLSSLILRGNPLKPLTTDRKEKVIWIKQNMHGLTSESRHRRKIVSPPKPASAG